MQAGAFGQSVDPRGGVPQNGPRDVEPSACAICVVAMRPAANS